MSVALIAVVTLLCASLARGDTFVIRNDVLSVGIDTEYGGAITTLIDNNDPSVNLINCHDHGREVQQSYYAGPDPYRGAQWGGGPWPWNPISSGDAFGHSSTVMVLNQTDTTLYVKARPLQWALDNVPCNCTFETFISLDANGAYVRNRLLNFRGDTTHYGPMSQELPAVYTIGVLSHLWAYTGDAPWSGDAISEVSYPAPGPPWQSFSATEHWAAFTDGIAQHYGVGVHHHNISSFLGGFHGTQGQGGSADDNTGYIAPVGTRDIVHDDTFVWCYHLAIGYVDTIRAYFGERRGAACEFPAV